MLTTITILISLLLWTTAICLGWFRPKPIQKTISLLWISAFVIFVIHIFAAFHEHYEWSHQVALTETARQTKETFKVETGVGLYVNYIFAICLVLDLWAQFKKGGTNHRWRNWIDGFVIFMLINGAIVFGTIQSRIVGGLCLAAIAFAKIAPSPTPRRKMD